MGKKMEKKTKKSIEIKSDWSRGENYPLDAYLIREEVFVKEQGRQREQEFDEIDQDAWHLVAYENDRPCGTLRVHNLGDKWQLSKLCVLPEHRGKNIGAALLNRAIETMPIGDDVYLLAEGENMEGFFARYGFEPVEDAVMHQRIPLHMSLLKLVGTLPPTQE